MFLISDLDCFSKVEACFKPALIKYLACKYNRPKLFSAVIMDAELRGKMKEWQLKSSEQQEFNLITVYLAKKEVSA